MRHVKEIKIMDIELDAVMRFQWTNDTMECVILSITRDYTDVMAVTSDPRVCKLMAVDLGIFVPGEQLPIRCTGSIIWHLESDEPTRKLGKYLVRIFVADISSVDQERLGTLIDQNRASVSSVHI